MITQQEAMEIARKRATARGWGLPEPLAVIERRSWLGKLLTYKVVSDPALRGTKARFTIDAITGEVLDEGYVPR